MKRILVMAILLWGCTAEAQNISVSGTALGQPDKLVRIIVYTDQFSRLDSTLATTTTDAWGNFNLSFNFDRPDYAFLALDMKRGEFYLEPGNSYQMYVYKDTIKGSVFDQLPLQFNLKELGDSLNGLIESFNFDYNTFILQHQKQLLRSKPAKLLQDFIRTEKDKFKAEMARKAYFRNYIIYSLASLEWASGVKGDSAVLHDYFTSKKVLYGNIAYTDLFRAFFKQYFKNPREFDYPDLVLAYNSGELAYVDSLLQQDHLLAKDNRVRQLALILLAAQNYYDRDINKGMVLDILAEIEQNGKYDRNKIIAGNFRKKLMKLSYGSRAPSLKLINDKGEQSTLEDFKGKFVLLDFITGTCKLCVHDFDKLEEMEDRLEKPFEVVIVVTDGKLEDVLPFIQNAHFHVFGLKEKVSSMEDYEIKIYPTYVIINPDGTMAMDPAPLPQEDLDVYLNGFMKRYQERTK